MASALEKIGREKEAALALEIAGIIDALFQKNLPAQS